MAIKEQKMSDRRNWLRLQVSISTMLWLTLCVACFFGGQHWDRMAKATAVMIRPPLPPRVPTALQVQMPHGHTHAITTGMQVNRLLAADPTVVKIVPISTMAFQVSGNRVGSTQVTVWDDS